MKKVLLVFIVLCFAHAVFCQQEENNYQVNTVFRNKAVRALGRVWCYYKQTDNGGWKICKHRRSVRGLYLNHRFMFGFAVAGLTNDLRVPEKFSSNKNLQLSYQYGQGHD